METEMNCTQSGQSGRGRAVFIAAAVTMAAAAVAAAAEGPLIDSMDGPSFRAPKEKGRLELVRGKSGKAVRFVFDNDCKNVFFFGRARGTPEWDGADGFSFWVKGDGSDHLGGIEIVWNENYGLRYAFAFPIDDTEWKKVVVPWRDLIPELPKPGSRPIAPRGGNAPSKLGSIWFGKWWYWRDYAAHSYAIDEIRLEPRIELDTNEYRPPGAPLARVLGKLKAGRPVTIVTMGDSLTDFRHWANRGINWPTLLVEGLKRKYGSRVELVNPAIGGTELRPNLVLLPRWTKAHPEADLVTVCFGYNDWSSGMREEVFFEALKDAVARIRRATKGRADVMLMTTCPAERWDTMAELAEAGRRAAKAKNAGLCDIYRAFHEAAGADRSRLYCSDRTHLGRAGHELVAEAVLEAIGNGGR